MEQLVNFIIRPPRADYNPKHDLLEDEFMLRGKWYKRKDIEVKNSRDDVLKCSHYVPIVSPEDKPLPCVVYCHGNSGCRADASEAAIILLPSNITVFALDFSGSGLSEGEHVTLGWNEKDDLKAVVEYLRTDGNVSLIGLWGRSMGAVTSLMYGAEDPSIAGMVLDSPFSDLVELMMELVDTYKFRLPKFTVKLAIQYMRKTIQKKAKFDIMDLNTIKVAQSCFVPALFGHAMEDDFIRPHHSDRILEAYMGDKNIIKFEGDHNSPRPQFYFDSVNIFFHNVLQPPEDEVPDYFGKGGWSTLNEFSYIPGSSSALKVTESSASSTVEAMEQVRSKRPMSRTEVPSDISSKNDHLEDEDTDDDDDPCPSSSSPNMISFELSNGHAYGPQVPNLMDDDQFVEYGLDDLTGFPSNLEEEERMLMEAVMLSLKDFEMQKPSAESEQTQSSVDSNSQEKVDLCTSSTAQDSKSIPEASYKQEEQAKSLSINNDNSSALQNQPSPESTSSAGLVSDSCHPVVEPASTVTSSRSDTSSNAVDCDVSDNTKATVTVERNPANNVMDGLIKRWDFNFFRNGR
ncbi:uncharacterized protein [Rutidosis leptorrhynchoides]|uniref:uncharacterized protein n=1 Tax=Rutidosis leptorrhynchoides TaxID=125765 RepID=UPI003A997566